MKKKYLFLLSFVLSCGFVASQNDTMFIMKAGNVIGQYKISEIDSVIFYKPTPQSDTFIDFRDGKTYKTVKIGNQWWMAENLAFDVGAGCWAYENYKSNLEVYGYLYTWTAAINACPEGWHLPSDAEWTELEIYLQNNGYNYDGVETTGNDRTTHNRIAKSLASSKGWSLSSVTGAAGNLDYPEYQNKSGFSALPGGLRQKIGGSFSNLGIGGYWWSSTRYSKPTEAIYRAWYRRIHHNSVDVYRDDPNHESNMFSVRCIKDN